MFIEELDTAAAKRAFQTELKFWGTHIEGLTRNRQTELLRRARRSPCLNEPAVELALYFHDLALVLDLEADVSMRLATGSAPQDASSFYDETEAPLERKALVLIGSDKLRNYAAGQGMLRERGDRVMNVLKLDCTDPSLVAGCIAHTSTAFAESLRLASRNMTTPENFQQVGEALRNDAGLLSLCDDIVFRANYERHVIGTPFEERLLLHFVLEVMHGDKPPVLSTKRTVLDTAVKRFRAFQGDCTKALTDRVWQLALERFPAYGEPGARPALYRATP